MGLKPLKGNDARKLLSSKNEQNYIFNLQTAAVVNLLRFQKFFISFVPINIKCMKSICKYKKVKPFLLSHEI